MNFSSNNDKINILARYKYITVQQIIRKYASDHSIQNPDHERECVHFYTSKAATFDLSTKRQERSTGRDVEMALQWEIKTALVLALLIRTGVVLYGEWQDRNSIVKFTDVDYNVFTDAAEYMTQVI